jgi:hypothetical protein
MGVNNLPIEGRFLLWNLFVAQNGEMVDGLVQHFCQKKNIITFVVVEKGKKANLNQAQGQGVIWVPSSTLTLCLFSMVQVSKVDMAKFTKWRLRTLIGCLHTLNFLNKSWKWKIITSYFFVLMWFNSLMFKLPKHKTWY